MKIEIDSKSGFCFGVVNAINQAENELQEKEVLYCLGDIVHNSEEVNRLENKGLKTIDYKDFPKMKGKKVLLRAHGEPPETYRIAKENSITIVDATCPVVLKLQERVAKAWEEMKKSDGKVVIFGKKGHAEVVGLIGQTNGDAIIVEKPTEINELDFSKPIILFSQTTMSPEDYKQLQNNIKVKMEEKLGSTIIPFKVYNSTCGQVSNRKNEIEKFAKRHQVVVFVSGVKSSNGKMLFEFCKNSNPRSYFVSGADELQNVWFKGVDDVGVCGATSTPVWLMEQIRDRIVYISK